MGAPNRQQLERALSRIATLADVLADSAAQASERCSDNSSVCDFRGLELMATQVGAIVELIAPMPIMHRGSAHAWLLGSDYDQLAHGGAA